MEYVYILVGGPWTMNIIKVIDPNGGMPQLLDLGLNNCLIAEEISPVFLWNSDEQCFWGFNPKIPGVYKITVCFKHAILLNNMFS